MGFQKIADDVQLGENVKIFEFVNLYGCSIGDESKVGAFVEIQKNATIGKRCKISSHTFICEGVTIEDNVFIGHNVSFINDSYPRATSGGRPQSEKDWQVEPTRICEGVSIGTSTTLLSNLTVGRSSIIGAGSVVTRDVPPGVVAAGNPCRVLRKLREGE